MVSVGTSRLFKKILIANRGEIVLRIVRTCQRLGIPTVAVYSDTDRCHPFTSSTDQSFSLGGERAQDSYLRGEKIIEIALRSGADAIHPGYGFLAENAEFAKQVQASGLTFIGPSVETMRLLGYKDSARKIAKQIGISTVPGYNGDDQTTKTLLKEATALGFPLLIKASAGGGGKGLRRVEKKGELGAALEGAKREAKAFFANDHLILEQLIKEPRHIEVQLVGDIKGNVLHFFERDCSIQRRHQKIIEECPAAMLNDTARAALLSAAVKLGHKAKVTNAITVEFLVESVAKQLADSQSANYYFLEANTRLQVEHPVTEMVTGFDLVELQLIAASGLPLPVCQEEISCRGSAVEARIYAEQPQNNFLPSGGRIVEVIGAQNTSNHLRFDHALSSGLVVSTEFDPMLGKIIGWGEDRSQALSAVTKFLTRFALPGLSTNCSFLTTVLETLKRSPHPLSVQYIDTHLQDLLRFKKQLSAETVLCCYLVAQIDGLCAQTSPGNSPSLDPFLREIYWRSSTMAGSSKLRIPQRGYTVSGNDEEGSHQLFGSISSFEISAQQKQFSLTATINKKDFKVSGVFEPDSTLFLTINNETYVVQTGSVLRLNGYLIINSKSYIVKEFVKQAPSLKTDEKQNFESKLIKSPLPGAVIAVRVKPQQSVSVGEPLIIIESMKMEHIIYAPSNGVVKKLAVELQENVKQGQLLLELSSCHSSAKT